MRNIYFTCLERKKLFNAEGQFIVISKLRESIAAFQTVGQSNTHSLSLENRYKLKCTTVSA
jgi:hypothetical protein